MTPPLRQLICIIAPLSSWGAYIITVIDEQLKSVHATGIQPLTAFISMIPMNIYDFLAIILVIIIAVTNIEFGPMAKEEIRALKTGQLYDKSKGEPPGNPEISTATTRGKVIDLLLPIAGLIFLLS